MEGERRIDVKWQEHSLLKISAVNSWYHPMDPSFLIMEASSDKIDSVEGTKKKKDISTDTPGLTRLVTFINLVCYLV